MTVLVLNAKSISICNGTKRNATVIFSGSIDPFVRGRKKKLEKVSSWNRLSSTKVHKLSVQSDRGNVNNLEDRRCSVSVVFYRFGTPLLRCHGDALANVNRQFCFDLPSLWRILMAISECTSHCHTCGHVKCKITLLTQKQLYGLKYFLLNGR